MEKVCFIICICYVEYDVATGDELVWSSTIINSCLDKDMAVKFAREEIDRRVDKLTEILPNGCKKIYNIDKESAKDYTTLFENDPVDGTPYLTTDGKYEDGEHIRGEYYLYIRDVPFMEELP